jgi:hypothetical protein
MSLLLLKIPDEGSHRFARNGCYGSVGACEVTSLWGGLMTCCLKMDVTDVTASSIATAIVMRHKPAARKANPPPDHSRPLLLSTSQQVVVTAVSRPNPQAATARTHGSPVALPGLVPR